MPIATPQGTLDFKSVDKVTFVGASSNTVIDTTTGSLGVGVGVGGPTSNLHVVGNTRLEGDINMLHTSNTASIKLNSNVVTEFPRSKKLIKYPRVLLTSASQDSYVVTASSELNNDYPMWEAFNGLFSPGGTGGTEGWIGSGSAYATSATSGEYLATSQDTFSGAPSGERNGSWIKIHLPQKIKLDHVVLKQRTSSGGVQEYNKSVVIYASTNDSTWQSLGSFDASGYVSATFHTNATTYYDYFVLHVRSTNHQYAYSCVQELQYFGTPEYDPEAHGTDVVVKSLPNVPNTDWLEVYYDGQDYTQTSDFAGTGGVVDKAGGDQDGTAGTGVTFDSTYKAFVFDGTADGKITGTHGLGTGTGITPTISLWFRMNDTSTNRFFVIGDQGPTNTSRQSITVGHHQGFVYLDYWYSEVQTPSTAVIPGVWYHLAIVHKGPGTTATGSQDIYLNNVKQTLNLHATNNGNSTLNLQGTGLTIGADPSGTTPLTGSIANFRLFNRALTSDEIYQLYAYQKEDFGHGVLGMTLKAGRLGIGTSEPRAALDVRGRIMREYYPGEVIEELHAVCASTSLRGKAVIQNVTAAQALTTSYADVTGSRVEDYIIPKGTTNIVYEYSFHTKFDMQHAISHWKLFYKVGEGTWTEASNARMDVSATYYDMRKICRWVFEIGANSEDASIGKLTAKAGDSFHVRWQAREYHANHAMTLHVTQYWDGGATDQFSRPQVMIKAIA